MLDKHKYVCYYNYTYMCWGALWKLITEHAVDASIWIGIIPKGLGSLTERTLVGVGVCEKTLMLKQTGAIRTWLIITLGE